MISGSIKRDRFASRATLELEYPWFRFLESKNGFTMLTLWDKQLPELVCSAASTGEYRLLDLVDFSAFKKLFFIRANPIVYSMKNVVRARRIKDLYRSNGKRVASRALLLTMKDDWSTENWNYW